MNLKTPANENSIGFNDGSCHYRSRSYYCQPVMAKPKPKARVAPAPAPRTLVAWGQLKSGLKEEVVYSGRGMRKVPGFGKANMFRRVSAVNYGSRGSWPGFSQRDRFAVRWSGFLVVRNPGVYRFSLKSDDGSKMYLDNRYVINNDGLHGMRNRYTNRRLVKGQQRLRVEYFENGGYAGCVFQYRGADTGNRFRLVSGNALRYVAEAGFKEEVYYNLRRLRSIPNLNRNAAMERVVSQVVYANTNRNWPGYTSSQNFAVRWTGTLQIRSSGRYRWSIGSDDGSKAYIQNRLIVNNDGLHGFRWKEADSRVAGRVLVRVEYFENGGHAGMLFRYMGRDTGNRMVYVKKGMTASF